MCFEILTYSMRTPASQSVAGKLPASRAIRGLSKSALKPKPIYKYHIVRN